MSLRLPHPWLIEMAERARRAATVWREVVVAGTPVRYALFDEPELARFGAFYTVEGEILAASSWGGADVRYADLAAYHERIEIDCKRAGQYHARAHRRALMLEVIAAKGLFSAAGELEAYLAWRIGVYPEGKVADPAGLVERLAALLAGEPMRRGALLGEITAASI